MDPSLLLEIVKLLKKYPQINLLLLFGSRSRGDAKNTSDWDFGYITGRAFDGLAFYSDLVLILKTDKVDLVDLSRANGLLRFRCAKDAIVIYDKTGHEFNRFWIQAVDFWCDAGPIIRAEYDALLGDLNDRAG